jgi:hypothetical protein
MIKPKPGRPPPGLVLPSCLLRRRQSDNTSLIALGQSRRGAAPARSRPTVVGVSYARSRKGADEPATQRTVEAASGQPALEWKPGASMPAPFRRAYTQYACESVKHCLLVQAAVNYQIAGSRSRSHDCSPERRMAVDLRQPQPVPPMTKLPTAAFTF